MELDEKSAMKNTEANTNFNSKIHLSLPKPELLRSHNISLPLHTPSRSVIEQDNKKEELLKTISSIDEKYYSSNCCDSRVNGSNPIEILLERLNQNQRDPNMYQPLEKNEEKIKKTTPAPLPLPVVKTKKVNIDACVENINDLLDIIYAYEDDESIDYNINISALHKIKQPLTELNNMIGMQSLKENVVDQILFYIQNLHGTQGNDFMHTVIYGPPGTGKTEIAKIMGSIFSKMGMLSKNIFKKVTRSDLVAGYLGQTALKTKDVIKESIGGVLFIDEAYSLGSQEKRDSFSKECIDTLCEALSDNKNNLMVIIAGYEKDLDECFFTQNQGLNSRFTWRFKTDEYSAEDLYKIFLKKVNDGGWTILEDVAIDVKWFEKHKKSFKCYGRDIETLFAKTKIAHSRRVFCMDESVKKKISLNDLNKGLDIYLKNNVSSTKKTQEDEMNKIISSMYV
jgi:SpoVK/Ycf46/Vps4 family AAA+-type ATPase